MHVAVVLDPAGRVLTTYLDGVKVGEATNVPSTLRSHMQRPNRLFIGRSQDDAAPTLHGRLRDVRIYRIALTDQQVAAIRNNGLPGRQTTGGAVRRRR